MDRTLIILLVALGLVYLAWLSARRQTAALRRRQQEHVERNSCTLEPRESADGHGFDVIGPDGRALETRALSWSVNGLGMIDIDSFRPGADAGGADGFAAGLNVELIDGDETPVPRLWVWDAAMTARAGAVPDRIAGDVRQWLDAGDVRECIVVWEELSGSTRAGLRLLLVHRDVDLDG